MKLKQRLKLIWFLLRGKNFGIIIDTDYATDGTLSNWKIHDVNIAVFILGYGTSEIKDCDIRA
jgi:hypothetical protein